MELDPLTIRRLAKLTLETRPEGITCDEWVHRVAEYLEASRRGQELDERLQVVARHAAACPSCVEELEALRALQNEPPA